VLGLALFVQPPAPACRDAWRSGGSAPRTARGRASVDANALWHTSDALACMGLDADYRGPHPISGGSDAPIEVVPGGRGLSRPGDAEQHRGAPRLRRGAPSVGGLGGPVEAPGTPSNIEERHGYAAALRAPGAWGARPGPGGA